MIWLVVVMLSVEALFFGNGTALLAALVITVIGIFLEKGENMISRIFFPVAFATGCVGLVFASVPFVVTAMAITVMAGFILTGE